ncbi:hypothetical protein [Phytohabitans aurantiacus]|uniref:Streptomyces killer toxin-like beta/gamma crystallin domain-containing protein n=1 Tax=Phytohabitans aurantiacus TaxID=3016789 RepID=A0ABQ5R621_9ACTN|nr:hypothetical protein [Phytohabitans aurantiacus]GLI01828.1 hypothetical protein Pa4123_71050 [Phytohabitans aurantiacus]
MRRILTAGSLALALLATMFAGTAVAAPPQTAPAAATRVLGAQAANIPPVYNNYLVCFNGWVYTDFTDPDGNDLQLRTFVLIYLRNGTARWIQMGNSGGAGHGVFFYLELASVGINPSDVTEYWFNAIDSPWGQWAGYVRANSSCNLI